MNSNNVWLTAVATNASTAAEGLKLGASHDLEPKPSLVSAPWLRVPHRQLRMITVEGTDDTIRTVERAHRPPTDAARVSSTSNRSYRVNL